MPRSSTAGVDGVGRFTACGCPGQHALSTMGRRRAPMQDGATSAGWRPTVRRRDGFSPRFSVRSRCWAWRVCLSWGIRAWVVGVVFGAGAGAVLALRDSPPGYVDKWRRGAEGERKTARIAATGRQPVDGRARRRRRPRQLRPHRGRPGRDIPARQQASPRNGSSRQRQTASPPSPRPGRRSLTRRLREHGGTFRPSAARRAQTPTGESVWVHAIVVLWSDSNQDLYRLGKCTLVRGNALRPRLLQQDAKLDQTSVARLSAAVEALAAGAQTMVR